MTALFMGIFSHSIDEKGRISIPAKFRKEAGSEEFVVTRGDDGCLALYTKEAWIGMVDQEMHKHSSGDEYNWFVRTRIAPAQEVALDNQGRVLVPARLLDHANLNREVEAVVVGALEKIEIWEPTKFNAYQNRDSSKQPLL